MTVAPLTERVSVTLSRGPVDAIVWPNDGGVLSDLRVIGRSVLAATPWAGVAPDRTAPALSEADWVERWRGGWQLCFPSAGAADPQSSWPQGFHGVASQAPWRVIDVEQSRVSLAWADEFALGAERTWSLTDFGARVETVVRNDGAAARPVVIAEHLILGGELLRPVFEDDAEVMLRVPPGALLAALDYEGHPVAEPEPWPGAAADRWERIDRTTPPRVAAVVDVEPRVIRVEAPHGVATVSWHGLAHALVWEELARSAEPPWNSAVVALGIEPTSAPHGRGTALAEGTIALEPGDTLSWAVDLAVEWRADVSEPPRTLTSLEQP